MDLLVIGGRGGGAYAPVAPPPPPAYGPAYGSHSPFSKQPIIISIVTKADYIHVRVISPIVSKAAFIPSTYFSDNSFVQENIFHKLVPY